MYPRVRKVAVAETTTTLPPDERPAVAELAAAVALWMVAAWAAVPLTEVSASARALAALARARALRAAHLTHAGAVPQAVFGAAARVLPHMRGAHRAERQPDPEGPGHSLSEGRLPLAPLQQPAAAARPLYRRPACRAPLLWLHHTIEFNRMYPNAADAAVTTAAAAAAAVTADTNVNVLHSWRLARPVLEVEEPG